MDTDKITTKSLLICLGAVVWLEAVLRVGTSQWRWDPMVALGVARLMEIGMMVLTLSIGKKRLSSIGLSLPGVIPGLRKGLVWSAGFGAVTGLAFVSLSIFGIDPVKLLRTPLPVNPGHIILFFAVGGLMGPVAEEIFFRGVLYGFFRQWGAPTAITLSTLAFILAHPIFSGVPVTQVVGGLLFAVAYEVEKNLMVPITIHSLGNLAIFSLSFL